MTVTISYYQNNYFTPLCLMVRTHKINAQHYLRLTWDSNTHPIQWFYRRTDVIWTHIATHCFSYTIQKKKKWLVMLLYVSFHPGWFVTSWSWNLYSRIWALSAGTTFMHDVSRVVVQNLIPDDIQLLKITENCTVSGEFSKYLPGCSIATLEYLAILHFYRLS